jgi:hypothetical protein
VFVALEKRSATEEAKDSSLSHRIENQGESESRHMFFRSLLGDAEIRVPGRGGKVYAAPTLICHYIDKHRYCPPQDFLDAVTGLAK